MSKHSIYFMFYLLQLSLPWSEWLFSRQNLIELAWNITLASPSLLSELFSASAQVVFLSWTW